MAWYRAGGGGIPSSLKTGMNSVLNKKFGTSTTYDPAGWPDDVNLLGKLPEKTASGAIATFEDGADDVPTKSIVVTIPPTLSGVSALTETQTGRNLADGNMSQDGAKRVILINNIYLVSSTYTLSLVIASPKNFYYKKHDSGSWDNLGGYNKSVVTFSISENDYYDFSYYISTGVSLDEISNLQLEVGSTAHAYEPYTTPTQYTASLGRTIYGGQVDIVNGEGTDENGNDFTFTGQEVPTRLGYNAFWSDEGDTEVTYRADIDLALGGN